VTEGDRQIGFEQLGIGGVIRKYRLSVPLHQREYSWTGKEVIALFRDIGKAISDTQPIYFLGSIVTIPKEDPTLEVVDGQQRLATTAILLAAIRDYLKPSTVDELIVRDIEDGFLTTVDRAARDRVSKLTLNVTDHHYFELRILKADTSAQSTAVSHRLIDQAAALAREHVRGIVRNLDPKDHGDGLNRWIDYLEHRAQIVLLKVPSEVNAYRMFETLNARGLRTSQSDLVKNYLFGQSGSRLSEAQQKWSGMRAVLESFEDEDITVNFLRQMLISLYGYMREDDVYEIVTGRARGVSQSIEFLSKLEAGAVDYAAILNPEHEKWNGYPPSIRRAVETLTLVRMRAIRPLQLSVARHFSAKEADKAMRVMIRLSVRFMIAGGARSAARSGAVEEALADTAHRVSSKKITTAGQLLLQLEPTVPKDPQFQEAFAMASVSNAKLARYYIRSLEMLLAREPHPLYLNDDPGAASLEHVLPRRPEGNWLQFSEQEAEALHRRLGNLALLGDKPNSDLKSLGFEAKKKVFATTPYELTKDIALLANWTPIEINDRQRRMAELAVKTWPLVAT
jgi:Protein of unknown function DUF262/Protein of unknown function (DUF1524)